MVDLPDTFVPGFHDENVVRKMKYVELGKTGLKVSKLALGTGGFSYLYGTYTLEECKKTVLEALKSGINFIDTAPFYGHGESEEVLGKCLEGIPRKAYYLATKVGRYEKDPKLMFNFTAAKVKEGFETSLARLKVDYIDLIQIHDIEFAPSLDIILNETLPAVEEIVKSGKAKHLGITGYPVSTLAECFKQSKVNIETILSYTRLTLIDNTLKDYLPLFQKHNVGLINAAVHSMGLLSSFGTPEWHPASKEIKDVCTEARNYCKDQNVEIGKLALYYSLQQNGPHVTLIGMNKVQVLKDNLEVCFNGLTDKEVKVLDYVTKQILNKLPPNCHWENYEITEYKKKINA